MKLGNGQSTVFWQDVWHKDDSMAERFPALYSHCKLQNLSVQAVVSGRLRRHLVPRLTTTAAAEKAELETIPGTILLSDCDDQRECPFAQPGGKLGTSGLLQTDQDKQMPRYAGRPRVLAIMCPASGANLRLAAHARQTAMPSKLAQENNC